METIWQDVRYSVRLLARQRGFALVSILTLALGIGASTAIFSVIDAAMLRPLPYPHPEQLVRVSVEIVQPTGRTARLSASYNDMLAWQSTGVFSSMTMWGSVSPGRVVDGDTPERVTVGEMTVDYLTVFGATPVLGRPFNADDMTPNAPPVLLLSNAYWRSHFGGDPGVIGRSIRFDDGTATIVGVLPAGFESDTPMWRPMHVADPAQRGSGRVVTARLANGISSEEAERRLTPLAATMPGPDGQPRKQAIRAASMLDDARTRYRTTVNVLAGAVGTILIIACVNVAGLLLARGATRQAELAVRASIGAGRGRLIRQLLTESVVLAVAAGLVGVVVAWLSLDALVANVPLAFSPDAPAALNVRVLGAALGLTRLDRSRVRTRAGAPVVAREHQRDARPRQSTSGIGAHPARRSAAHRRGNRPGRRPRRRRGVDGPQLCARAVCRSRLRTGRDRHDEGHAAQRRSRRPHAVLPAVARDAAADPRRHGRGRRRQRSTRRQRIVRRFSRRRQVHGRGRRALPARLFSGHRAAGVARPAADRGGRSERTQPGHDQHGRRAGPLSRRIGRRTAGLPREWKDAAAVGSHRRGPERPPRRRAFRHAAAGLPSVPPDAADERAQPQHDRRAAHVTFDPGTRRHAAEGGARRGPARARRADSHRATSCSRAICSGRGSGPCCSRCSADSASCWRSSACSA